MPDDEFTATVVLDREIRAFELARAEHARSVSAARFMAHHFGQTSSLDLIRSGETDLAAIRDSLTDARLDVGRDGIVRGLRRQLGASRVVARLGIRLGGVRPKPSVVEIVCNRGTATQARDLINNLFTEATAENRRKGLWAAPHHFVLEPLGEGVQEIVETFGGAPIPSHFYAHHGDKSGLKLAASPDYDLELGGTIRLGDGTPIGGVRYQFRDEDNGFRLRVCDEVPRAFPQSMVDVHRLNIACEFVVWFTDRFSRPA